MVIVYFPTYTKLHSRLRALSILVHNNIFSAQKSNLAHHRIMKEIDPYKIKLIGSRIKNYQKEKWQSAAKQIAIKANSAKFFQNKALLEILKAIGDMRIVEASRDQFWGTGIHLRDIGGLDQSFWYNSCGLMEEILVVIRASYSPTQNNINIDVFSKLLKATSP